MFLSGFALLCRLSQAALLAKCPERETPYTAEDDLLLKKGAPESVASTVAPKPKAKANGKGPLTIYLFHACCLSSRRVTTCSPLS